jgi:hypothetical protein
VPSGYQSFALKMYAAGPFNMLVTVYQTALRHIMKDSKKKLALQQAVEACRVEEPTLSRQSAHRWWQGWQLYAPAALYSPETLLCFRFWHSFLLEAE